MLFKVKGILDFYPEDISKKHIAQSEWKRVAIIKTNCDIAHYYAWYLKTRFNLILNEPVRGTHVTFISDRVNNIKYDTVGQELNGKEITFYYENTPKSNGKHWWLRVWSTDAEDIRESIGIDRIPYFSFHLTLGYANEKNIEHSKYILECCKKFELLPNESRKSINEYFIVE